MNGDKPDLSCKQVSTPHERRCSSGHIASETFKIEGKDGTEAPTRFFEIYQIDTYLGTFCEACLIIANHIASQQKKKR